jgi:hypothetical protein
MASKASQKYLPPKADISIVVGLAKSKLHP